MGCVPLQLCLENLSSLAAALAVLLRVRREGRQPDAVLNSIHRKRSQMPKIKQISKTKGWVGSQGHPLGLPWPKPSSASQQRLCKPAAILQLGGNTALQVSSFRASPYPPFCFPPGKSRILWHEGSLTATCFRHMWGAVTMCHSTAVPVPVCFLSVPPAPMAMQRSVLGWGHACFGGTPAAKVRRWRGEGP